MPRRRAVPWVFAQATERNERLQSLLSALVLRRPQSEGLRHDCWPWPLVFGDTTTRRSIVLVVWEDDDNGSAWSDDVVHALQECTHLSPGWFLLRLPSGRQLSHTGARLQDMICDEAADVFFLVGSQASLSRVSTFWAETRSGVDPNVKGILSVVVGNEPASGGATSAGPAVPTSMTRVPRNVVHWTIRVAAPPTTPRDVLQMVRAEPNTLGLVLSVRPSTAWLVRAVLGFATAVQQTGPSPTVRARL